MLIVAQRTCDDENRLCPIGSEDKVMKGYLAKGYFQGGNRRYEVSARTQVYLSKTKLKLQVGI